MKFRSQNAITMDATVKRILALDGTPVPTGTSKQPTCEW
jgi:hypothetical protein